MASLRNSSFSIFFISGAKIAYGVWTLNYAKFQNFEKKMFAAFQFFFTFKIEIGSRSYSFLSMVLLVKPSPLPKTNSQLKKITGFIIPGTTPKFQDLNTPKIHIQSCILYRKKLHKFFELKKMLKFVNKQCWQHLRHE